MLIITKTEIIGGFPNVGSIAIFFSTELSIASWIKVYLRTIEQ